MSVEVEVDSSITSLSLLRQCSDRTVHQVSPASSSRQLGVCVCVCCVCVLCVCSCSHISVFLQPAFLAALAAELANVGRSAVARMAAGLQLKNYLTAKDPQLKANRQTQWLSMDAAVRMQIKALVS